MPQRDEQQPYMVRYQGPDGGLLTGFTVRGETALIKSFADMAHRPEITLTWRTWPGLNGPDHDPDPWRTKDELPPAAAPAENGDTP